MTIKLYKPNTAGRRNASSLEPSRLTKKEPEKSLMGGLAKKSAGRNNRGRVTTRHRGGGAKRLLRTIDWKRDKYDVPGIVVAIEYYPNHTPNN